MIFFAFLLILFFSNFSSRAEMNAFQQSQTVCGVVCLEFPAAIYMSSSLTQFLKLLAKAHNSYSFT